MAQTNDAVPPVPPTMQAVVFNFETDAFVRGYPSPAFRPSHEQFAAHARSGASATVAAVVARLDVVALPT